MKRRLLIVNADGYGLSEGVNRGIEEVCLAGFVRSISAVPNGPAIADLKSFVRRFPQVGVGVHFNLSVGSPVLPPERVQSLVNTSGEFYRGEFVARAWTGEFRLEEMQAELVAQVERLRELGAVLDHWDSHQGLHVHAPFLWAAMRAARRTGLEWVRSHDYWLFRGEASRVEVARFFAGHPVRMATFAARRAAMVVLRRAGFQCADRAALLGVLPRTDPGDPATWRRLLHALPAGLTEVWCHPGYPDDTLRQLATLVTTREAEAQALSDASLAEEARAIGVEVVRFRDVAWGRMR